MTSTFKFAKTFGRYAIVNIKNSMRTCRTYHQHYFREVRKFMEKQKLGISPSVRSFSSEFDKTNDKELIVKHDPSKRMFYIDVDGVCSGYIAYERKDDLIILKHTYVSNELGGRGVGKILAKESLEYVAKNALQLEIHCSFVRSYVSKYEPKYIKYIQK